MTYLDNGAGSLQTKPCGPTHRRRIAALSLQQIGAIDGCRSNLHQYLIVLDYGIRNFCPVDTPILSHQYSMHKAIPFQEIFVV